MLCVGFSLVAGEIPELAISDSFSLASALLHLGEEGAASLSICCLCDISVIFLIIKERGKNGFSVEGLSIQSRHTQCTLVKYSINLWIHRGGACALEGRKDARRNSTCLIKYWLFVYLLP